MTWAYFYLMKDDPVRVRETAPRHARYWRDAHPADIAGPFGDRSGGLIIFRARDEPAAEHAIAADPFQLLGLLEEWWLKAWEPVGGQPMTEASVSSVVD